MRHFLAINDVTPAELRRILTLANADPVTHGDPYARQGIACVFEKPSARTRNSSEIAVMQLGGHPVYITDAEVGIDKRESAEDVARTLACYHEVICARVFSHDVLVRMAALNTVPIVNLLSDVSHPLQAIADVLTIEAEFGSIEGRVVTYVGDANNVARSLALAVCALGGEFRISSPSGYTFMQADLDALVMAKAHFIVGTLDEVIPGSDVVYTDTWTSMGQEAEHEQRLLDFAGYTVDHSMMVKTDGAIFMHCLPAHRGEEVADEVMDGAASRIWPQAANRLNAIRGVLAWLNEVRT